MQAKHCYHNSMVILKAPPTVSRPLQGRGAWATAHQMKHTAVFLERSEAEQTVCYFGCLAQIDDWKNSTM